MERVEHEAIKIEVTAPQSMSTAAASPAANAWWLLCALIFAIKFFLLWLDPTPKLFLGDSGAYIWTALTGWIPTDRSYFYGYLVRWLAVWPHSFGPLLLSQMLISAVTAIVFVLICSRFFRMSNKLSFLFGLMCALDPCQLVWERYVMTETFSLLVYVLVLYWSLAYLRDRRLWQLAVVQALSVLLIGFRMSFLPVVEAGTILLPLIAFAPCALAALRKRLEARVPQWSVLATGLAHLAASIAMMFVMHGAYKYANGYLSKREPGYLYDAGAHLAAVWAPALEPSDATDPRFGELIANGHQFKIKTLGLRNAQQYGKGLLMDRWREIEKDPRQNDRVARETAINALQHRPLVIVGLAVKTYMGYWNPESIRRYARIDLGYGRMNDGQVKMLADTFGFQTVKDPRTQPHSLLQQYFVGSWPYYLIVIVSPLICAFAIWLGRDRAFAFLLFIHSSILMVVVTVLSPQPCIRYLQPVSVLTLLSIAICVDGFARRARPATMQSAS
ncbi:MAG TPA: hypothetical protein VGI59_10130 [Candidatus Udaeobacter sp.]